MSTEWWYEEGGQVNGPLGSDALRSLVETGVLASSSRVIAVGGTEWGTIDEHALELGVVPQTQSQAPPSPPPPGLTQTRVYTPPPAAAPPPTGPLAPVPLASNGKRFGAWVLDVVILSVSVITLFLGWLIWALVIFGNGQTPGKQLLGIRVVDANTRRVVTYGNMALRTLIYEGLLGSVTGGITTLIGGIMILADERQHQALWDKMATTLVVDDPTGRTL